MQSLVKTSTGQRYRTKPQNAFSAFYLAQKITITRGVARMNSRLKGRSGHLRTEVHSKPGGVSSPESHATIKPVPMIMRVIRAMIMMPWFRCASRVIVCAGLDVNTAEVLSIKEEAFVSRETQRKYKIPPYKSPNLKYQSISVARQKHLTQAWQAIHSVGSPAPSESPSYG